MCMCILKIKPALASHAVLTLEKKKKILLKQSESQLKE